MITTSDLRRPSSKSGYRHVGKSTGPKPYQAVVRYRKGLSGSRAVAPRRATALEAAQDYCDYVNSGQYASNPSLASAGHKAKPREKFTDPEVLAALGVLRDARAQRAGKQGYVYLIVEDIPGGGLLYGKIGYSTNPEKRVAELQTGNPRPLRLHLKKPGTVEDEARLHQKYIDKNALQEWFFITKELLLEWDASHQVPTAA